MELRHLRYFAAVADAGNVSRAARRLHMTQPALSRQIQDLERDLACRLFDRIGRRVVLTQDGDEILERTRRLLADAEALRERAQAPLRPKRLIGAECIPTTRGHLPL